MQKYAIKQILNNRILHIRYNKWKWIFEDNYKKIYKGEVLGLDQMTKSKKDSTSTEWNIKIKLSAWLIKFRSLRVTT